MEHGKGHEVTVIKKEEDDIYWGKGVSLKVKFKSYENLKIGQKYFVNLKNVLEEELLDETLHDYEKID